ncbi:biotin/lipoyl-binding protein [Paraburkholderia sp. Clong3]|uniref:biotin/lipoyl-binding protein n=1 Tax=Paraburkholderia sp. Clong3 TaxID=2991061 RepID=UPI003D190549
MSGSVTRVLVHDGDRVSRGQPLLTIDDAVQAATVAQLVAQAEAAREISRAFRYGSAPLTRLTPINIRAARLRRLGSGTSVSYPYDDAPDRAQFDCVH